MAAWAATSPVPAEAPGEPVERVEVRLHLIDVAVVDGKGRPQVGLDVDDFVVRVDGQSRAIVSFDSAVGPPVGEDPASLPTPGGAPRWTVLCFDADRISPTHRQIALKTARGVVESGRPDDRFALALLRAGDLVMVREFAAAHEVSTSRFLEDPGQLLGPLPPLEQRVRELTGRLATCRGNRDEAGCVVDAAAEFVALIGKENDAALAALTGLAAALDPLPGRKALVLFSDGLLLDPAEIVMRAASRFQGIERARSRFMPSRRAPFETLLQRATRARVGIFWLRTGSGLSGLDAGRAGIASITDPSAELPFRAVAARLEETLRTATEATAGQAVLTPLGRKVGATLLGHLDAAYTLGVEPQAGDGLRPRLQVRLKGGRGRVLAPARLPVAQPQPQRIRGSIAAEARGAAEVVLRLTLEPPRRLADAAGPQRVSLYAQLFRGPARVDERYEILEFPADRADGSALSHLMHFTVEPGEYAVRVSVSDLLGSGRVTLETGFSMPE